MTRKASKARTLAALLPRVSLFRIPEFIHLPVAEFERDPEALLDRIAASFAGRSLVIRSSASDEDGGVHSKAGAYDSVLDVAADDRQQLRQAIATVAASYRRDRLPMADDEIIVQAFLQDTAMSGVVFTHDLNTGAPYYVINYDDISGLTNTVTSGGGEYANRTLYIHRGATAALRSSRFQRLIAAVQELEGLIGSQFLDIEFALDQALHPYLLQVRAITTQPNWNRGVARRIDAELGGIQAFVRQRLRPMAGVFGATTVLGQMPDWNPAEMIGRAPRALSLSLYRRLVTDNAWRLARQDMGYAVPAGQPLMVSLAGQPFIDTRLSFHSYLPATLPEPLAVKLVDAWVARLRAQPELHDKIEFDVAITTFSFDLDARLEALAGTALDADERACFRSALRDLTGPLLRGSGPGSIAAALARVETLAARRFDSSAGNIAELFALADDCLRYGTVPFAMLARHGFIARTLLLSLCARGVFTAAEVAALQAGVRTVAGELVGDMRALQQGRLSRQDFMRRYGHLRPGTYDILSPRYDQMEDFGVGPAAAAEAPAETPAFALTPAQRHGIELLLAAEGWSDLSPEQLLDYIAAAIAGREYGKFVFTRSVSAILELVAAFGEHHGLSREEMSHVPLDCLLEVALCSADSSIEERLRGVAEREAERHALTVAIRLPQVLFDEAGVHVVPFQVSQPNFITARKLTAEVVYLDARSTPPALTGRIVLIENADPGYDWIFAQRIGGLVTKYGGANSHMAIRCAEFGIPAAIGCGEQRFEAFVQASRISLDCAAGLVTPLH